MNDTENRDKPDTNQLENPGELKIIDPLDTSLSSEGEAQDRRAWFKRSAKPLQKLLENFRNKQGAKKKGKDEKPRGEKPKIKVNTNSVLKDLRNGMDDNSLMEKHGLTLRQLQRLYRKMIKSGMLTPMEVSDRLCVTTSQIEKAFKQAAELLEEQDPRGKG